MTCPLPRRKGFMGLQAPFIVRRPFMAATGALGLERPEHADDALKGFSPSSVRRPFMAATTPNGSKQP